MNIFLQNLTRLGRVQKKIIVGFLDYCSLSVAFLLALLSNEISITKIDESLLSYILILPITTVLIFYLFGVYSSVLRYLDFSLLTKLFFGLVMSLILNIFILTFLKYYNLESPKFVTLDIFGWIMVLLSAQIIITSSRLLANFLFRERSEIRVVIYGAGSAGIQLASALKVSREMQPIAFIDRNEALHNTTLGNLKILPPQQLKKLIKRKKVDQVLIAIPSASKSTLRSLLAEIEQYSVRVRILPGLAEIAQGKVRVSELKEVETSDLLGRFKVEASQELIDKNIKNKSVLITGAGGSIGSEISRQVVSNGAKRVLLLDSSEFALYAIKKKLEELPFSSNIIAILGNVTDKNRILNICRSFDVQTIYHAAAYKHVPIVEENPFEAVTNNIFGTKNCLEAACEAGIETFVLISTDKAVRPTNIMGATKRFAELILQAHSSERANLDTKMTMVRFGNVIGSSGSAIPLFQRQIKEGGPVTVTDPNVIRYFMTIPEASELVIQAGAMGQGGDVFVLDKGEPIKIVDLAKRLINLSGLEVKDLHNPNGDIEIKFTGLRPGEKLYEELLIGDNVSKTKHKQILRAEENFISVSEIENYCTALLHARENNDVETLRSIFLKTISGFKPEKIVDSLYLQNNPR